MKKKLIQLLMTAFLMLAVVACGTQNLNGKLRQLELGMTKKEVTNILGNNYNPVGAVSTPRGDLDTIEYDSFLGDEICVVRFMDGKLVEWFKEVRVVPETPEQQNKRPVEKPVRPR